VYSVAIHPSGKLALSAGKDKTLRTWNLMTAKAAYVTNIKEGGLLNRLDFVPLGFYATYFT